MEKKLIAYLKNIMNSKKFLITKEMYETSNLRWKEGSWKNSIFNLISLVQTFFCYTRTYIKFQLYYYDVTKTC